MSDKYTLDLEGKVLRVNGVQEAIMSSPLSNLVGCWELAAVQFWDELAAAKRDLNLSSELAQTFKAKAEHWEQLAKVNGKRVRELRGELAESEKAVKHWQETAHHVAAQLRVAQSPGKELAELKADDQWYVLPGGDGTLVSKLVRLDGDLYAVKYVTTQATPSQPMPPVPPSPWSQPSFGGFVSYTMPKGVKPTPLADSDKEAARALLKCGVTPTLKLLEELAEAFGK